MTEFKLIKNQYLKLRSAHLRILDKFDDASYYYQPTDVSNATAWITPHCPAFEKIMVVDKIDNYFFDDFISQKEVDLYKPGLDAFKFQKEDLMEIENAINLLKKTEEASVTFLDDIIAQDKKIEEVDLDIAKSKYLLNISHETEHLGQLKYLLGTWKRLNK